MPRHLSSHFTLEEMIHSQAATRQRIDNSPSPEILSNLRRLAATLEEVRSLLGDAPILISSGYRCPALNRATSGSKKALTCTDLLLTLPHQPSVRFFKPRKKSDLQEWHLTNSFTSMVNGCT